MKDMKLLPLNDPLMKKVPEQFEDWDNVQEFVDRLWNYQNSIGGVGLSANQVGLDASVFTMGHGVHRWDIINPKLISNSEEVVTMEEGCLSAPGLMLKVKRPERCTLTYKNAENEDVIEEFEGIWARIALHEYDHMLGQSFLQRVGPVQLERAVKKIKKQTKKMIQRREKNV
jgi:peptide deformylase